MDVVFRAAPHILFSHTLMVIGHRTSYIRNWKQEIANRIMWDQTRFISSKLHIFTRYFPGHSPEWFHSFSQKFKILERNSVQDNFEERCWHSLTIILRKINLMLFYLLQKFDDANFPRIYKFFDILDFQHLQCSCQKLNFMVLKCWLLTFSFRKMRPVNLQFQWRWDLLTFSFSEDETCC